MEYKEQLKEFSVLAEPVLAWLKDGAKHIDMNGTIYGFNMEFICSISRAPDYQGAYCGTVMCIAGAIIEMQSAVFKKKYRDLEDLKGLFPDLPLHSLFYPQRSEEYDSEETDRVCYEGITPDVAVVVLEHFMETGEVIWEQYSNENGWSL